MKQSKQLLKINGESLLRKTIAVAKDSGVRNIVAVLGANEAQHREEIADTATVVFNPEWQSGMGSSLKIGIRFIAQEFPSAEVVIVLVCDQPLLTSAHLKNLIEEWKLTKRPIVASRYSGSPGVPVLFHRSFFKDILSIEDDHGAKKLVTKHLGQATLVDFPEGAIDLDTPEDLKNFVQRKP
ncbi:MAG: nucleotidyltransferase family protein [Bacteroidetes bacterium]|nr:nucleotidyltransferase family protein [Bacteroidota bacterium]